MESLQYTLVVESRIRVSKSVQIFFCHSLDTWPHAQPVGKTKTGAVFIDEVCQVLLVGAVLQASCLQQ